MEVPPPSIWHNYKYLQQRFASLKPCFKTVKASATGDISNQTLFKDICNAILNILNHHHYPLFLLVAWSHFQLEIPIMPLWLVKTLFKLLESLEIEPDLNINCTRGQQDFGVETCAFQLPCKVNNMPCLQRKYGKHQENISQDQILLKYFFFLCAVQINSTHLVQNKTSEPCERPAYKLKRMSLKNAGACVLLHLYLNPLLVCFKRNWTISVLQAPWLSSLEESKQNWVLLSSGPA